MKFIVENILITESFFRRKEVINFENYPSAKSELEINPSAHIGEESIIVKLKATLRQVFEEEVLVESYTIAMGMFKTEGERDTVTIGNFVNINAPAIIFPYIRESLSSASVKAGLSPILIQPINFIELATSEQSNLAPQPNN